MALILYRRWHWHTYLEMLLWRFSYIRFWRLLPAVEHLANPMVLTGAWVAQVMTEEQMKLHEGSPHVKAIHLGHIGV